MRQQENTTAIVARVNALTARSLTGPRADLDVEALAGRLEAARPALLARLTAAGEDQPAAMLAGWLAGTLDQLDAPRIDTVLQAREDGADERSWHECLEGAVRLLLARPLRVDEVVDGSAFPRLVASILADGADAGDIAAELRHHAIDLDADVAEAVIARARRDRRRYDVAVTSRDGATPLLVAGNPWDRAHQAQYTRDVSPVIPSPAAIGSLRAVGPLVEAGARRGYWQALLRAAGVDVIAFATRTTALDYTVQHWSPIAPAEPEVVYGFPDRTLLLVQPPNDDPYAAMALAAYRGNCVVYLGDGGGHERLIRDLQEKWTIADRFDLPNWAATRNHLTIYRLTS